MHNFRRLTIWVKAIEVVTEVYRISSQFPNNEKFGLVSQMRRAAVSIASKIAEGVGRSSDDQFKYFLQIAVGSSNEVLTHLEIALHLGFCPESEIAECAKCLEHLINMILKFTGNLKSFV